MGKVFQVKSIRNSQYEWGNRMDLQSTDGVYRYSEEQ
jgi:hypothetical protein